MDEYSVDGAVGTRQRRADAERSIEAILTAALQRVQGGGTLDNMTAIARAAGLSRATLYAHFPTREALMAAAVRHSVTLAEEALRDVEPQFENAPAAEALTELLRCSWQVLERNRSLYRVAAEAISAPGLRAHTEPILGRVGRLISRGQHEGAFRADLPGDWLVETTYTLMHLAAEQVNDGRLAADTAADVVTTTIVSILSRS